MPELPEVECVIRSLKKNLIGQKIEDIESNYKNMILEDFDSFKNKLVGKTFDDIKRKGKFIIFKLKDIYLVSHLRMEGKYFLEEKNSMSNKHIHVIFHLTDYDLYYQDVRKFGIMVTKNEESLYTTPPLDHVANDPIEGIDVDELYKNITKRKKNIKEILLDQSIISGLGNIYVDEVLFKTRISPLRSGKDITRDEVINIIKESKDIFLESISLGGSTIKSYTSSKNHIGHFQDKLLVHTKDVCPVCGRKLEVIKIGGRSTYYCPNCQK